MLFEENNGNFENQFLFLMIPSRIIIPSLLNHVEDPLFFYDHFKDLLFSIEKDVLIHFFLNFKF